VATAQDSIEIAEIEIELKEGERADVARLARNLANEIPIMFVARTKAEWGYALLGGTVNQGKVSACLRPLFETANLSSISVPKFLRSALDVGDKRFAEPLFRRRTRHFD
jgi:inorganic triphosphatase YgiF